MKNRKPIKSSYYGLPLEYRIEHRRDNSDVHPTLILSYRASDDASLHYEHPPRRINNWFDLVKEYLSQKRDPNSGITAKTFLEFLPTEIMQDFCEGFLGLKRKQGNRKKVRKKETVHHVKGKSQKRNTPKK